MTRATQTPELIIKEILTPDDTTTIDKHIHRILSDVTRDSLFKYCTKYVDDGIYEAKDSFDITVQIKTKLPTYITTSMPLFSPAMYPLTEDKTMFASDRPYNYLTTFNVVSLDSYDSNNPSVAAALNLIAMQSQSRFTHIWRELAAVLLALDSLLLNYGHVLRYYTNALLSQYQSFPFYESKGMILFNDKNCLSILPTFIYMLMSVGTDVVIGNISEIDAYLVIDHYLRIGNESYYDKKLKIKSVLRDWLTEALHKLGNVITILWTKEGLPYGIQNKNTKECKEVVRQMKVTKEKMFATLDAHTYAYIWNRVNIINNIEQVATLFLITHSMSNDRTYYKTLVELCFDAAAAPRLDQKIVRGPCETVRVADTKFVSEMSFKIESADGDESKPLNDVLYGTEKVLKCYTPRLYDICKGLDLDSEFLKFLSTSSAGKKLDNDTLSRYGQLTKKLSNRRLARFGLEHANFKSQIIERNSMQDATTLVVRQQIDRRQRTIAGLSNDKLMTTFPSYMLGKQFYRLSNYVAQGKQSGNVRDVVDLLVATTYARGLCSSMDIKGMDAAIQPTLRRVYDTMTFTVGDMVQSVRFGPWLSAPIRYEKLVQLGETKAVKECILETSGLKKASVFGASTMQTSTTHFSKIFNSSIHNREGTFESGRADASTHHTVLLSGALQYSYFIRKALMLPVHRSFVKVMGDDVFAVYNSRTTNLYDEAKFDAEQLQDLGFTVDLSVSANHGIFLQQHIVLGRVFGLANRVSVLTREYTKVNNSLHEASKELLALVDDLNSRVKSHKGLRLLTWAIGCFCLLRHTIQITDSRCNNIVNFLKEYFSIEMYSKPKSSKSQSSGTQLVTIYVPYVWLFMHKGGEMPSPSFVNEYDCIITPIQALTSPKGQFKRRNLIEIIGIGNYDVNSFGTQKIFYDFKFSEAQLFIDINFESLAQKSRLSDAEKGEVENLAFNLDALDNQEQIDRSRIAYGILSNAQIKIDKSLVSGYAHLTKLTQLVISGELDNTNVFIFSEDLYTVIKKYNARLLQRRIIKPYFVEDVFHLWDIEYTTQDVELCSDAGYYYQCPLTFSMQYWGDSLKLLLLLGMPSSNEQYYASELANIRGRFHNFKFSDPVFKAMHMISRKAHSMLDVFFQAIGANEREQSIYREALKYYNEFGSVLYDYDVSPRQLFCLTQQTSIIRDRILLQDVTLPELPASVNLGANLVRNLMTTYGYTFLLSNIASFTFKKFFVRCSPSLIHHLSSMHTLDAV